MKAKLAALAVVGMSLAGCSSSTGATEDEATTTEVGTTEEVSEEPTDVEEEPETTEPESEEPETTVEEVAEPEPAVTTAPPAAPAPTVAPAAPTQEPTSPAPSFDTSIYGDSVTNARGNLVKQVGQLAGIGLSDGSTGVQFTVTNIESNFQCTSPWAEPPMNGQFVAITMDINVMPELANATPSEIWVTPYDFTIYSPDGTRENDSIGNSYYCLNDAEAIPSYIRPGEHAVGKIVLDTSYPTGSILYTVDGVSGWEWSY